MKNLFPLLTDSYKLSHYLQYPDNTTNVYSYFESRGGDFKETVFFGLQYILDEYFCEIVTKEAVDLAEEFAKRHFGQPLFNRKGWDHIVNKHGGKLPLRIKAVPEGTVVPTGNILMSVENTDTECYWLTNYVETLLVQVWYPSTVATISREAKKKIYKALERTGNPELVDYKLHDFGFRGVSSVESAKIGGMAHLVNFLGTDTIPGIIGAMTYYDAEMCGFSIPAAEHSTITSWGREHEEDAYRNMLTKYPTGLVAVPSDSFNIFVACSEIWGEKLKAEVLGRDGTLVVRPDSGEPSVIDLDVLERLGAKFGYTLNDKGFKVLNDKVRVIQGDGMDLAEIGQVLWVLETYGWSADNITFGMGGGLLQKNNRDTSKYAFKCSSAIVDGQPVDVFKEPVTDPGKNSKKGRLKLVKDDKGEFVTVPECLDIPKDELVTVYENGKITQRWNFEEVREMAKVS